MRSFLLLLMAALLCSATACGSGEASMSADKSMPNVTGKRLDVAVDAIEKAGLDPDAIKYVGGGTLGPVVKSSWQVCAQVPAAGKPATSGLQLTIERSCDGSASGQSSSESSTPSAPKTAAVLTAKNNREFAQLLQVPDGCSDEAATFATKYAGRSIEFDASVATLTNHDDYKTRYDILIAPGDKGPESTRGPNFQFQDVSVFDLKITSANRSSIAAGDKLRLVAEVGEYNTQNCLFALTPVSTTFR